MAHTISVDDGTFGTLKRLANENGRTIVGQIRWLLESNMGAAIDNVQRTTDQPSDKGLSAVEESELQMMNNRLQYFEEGSPEYEAALERISELQKKD